MAKTQKKTTKRKVPNNSDEVDIKKHKTTENPNEISSPATSITPNQTPVPPASDSYSDSDSDSEELPKLLEPYSKEQLINLICEAALNNRALYDVVLAAADRDVSHRKIFVHGLGWDTTRETLVSAFEPFGEIEDCNVVTDRNTGKAKGYGFVVFKSRKGASKALKEPKKKIGNRWASCQLASVGPIAVKEKETDMPARKIYVSKVPSSVDAEKLREFFARYGEIELGPLGFDVKTGKSKGYALFVYKTVEGAKKALEEPMKMFEGHQLHCQKAADGKGKNSVQGLQAQEPVQSQVLQQQVPVLAAAAQNLALLGQHPGMNPVYGQLLANAGVGLIGQVNPVLPGGFPINQGMIPTSQMVAGASSGYGAGTPGLDGLAGSNSSLLGVTASQLQGLQYMYPSTQVGGSAAPQLRGLQHLYPNSQAVQAVNGRAQSQGAFGSFSSGYPTTSIWCGQFL